MVHDDQWTFFFYGWWWFMMVHGASWWETNGWWWLLMVGDGSCAVQANDVLNDGWLMRQNLVVDGGEWAVADGWWSLMRGKPNSQETQKPEGGTDERQWEGAGRNQDSHWCPALYFYGDSLPKYRPKTVEKSCSGPIILGRRMATAPSAMYPSSDAHWFL